MRVMSVLGCLLAGCNAVFQLPATQLEPPVDAAADGPGCSDGVFGEAQVLAMFEGGVREYEPALRHDGLELWFEVENPLRDEIWVSTRATVTESFGAPQLAPFSGPDVSNLDDSDPALTGDGKRLIFRSGRAGGNDVWEVTRPDLASPFGEPRQVTGFAGKNLLTLDVSHDGLALYFTDSSAIDEATYVMRRPAVDQPFGEAAVVAIDAPWASISPDELELFYNAVGTSQVARRVRTDPMAAFDGPETILADSGDHPDLAGDGRTLVIARSGGLVLLQRACP